MIRDIENECKFVFYEVYKDMESIAKHKTMPHFQLWSDFKASGGVVSQTAVKGAAILYDLWYLLEKSFVTEQETQDQFFWWFEPMMVAYEMRWLSAYFVST